MWPDGPASGFKRERSSTITASMKRPLYRISRFIFIPMPIRYYTTALSQEKAAKGCVLFNIVFTFNVLHVCNKYINPARSAWRDLSCWNRADPGFSMRFGVMRVKNDSHRTEPSCLGWIKRYIIFHENQPPRDLGDVLISEFSGTERSRIHKNTDRETQALDGEQGCFGCRVSAKLGPRVAPREVTRPTWRQAGVADGFASHRCAMQMQNPN